MTIFRGRGKIQNMGRMTNKHFTALLALLMRASAHGCANQLQAMHKPAGVCILKAKIRGGRPRHSNLLKEMTGLISDTLPWINVSDGGHLENLGVYELLRRRCRFIIAVDGECDSAHSLGSLIQLFRFAKIDFKRQH